MKQAINQTGALLLGAAIKKHFPHVEFEGSNADSVEFRCSFLDTEKFDESYLGLLENTMRKLSVEEIETMEMVASNAAELFAHLGQNRLAERMRGGKEIVSIGRIGKFADIGEPGEPCKTFSLLGFKQRKGKVEVYGAGFETDRDKKTFLKKHRDYPKKEGLFLAKELDLFEGDFWHPRGILLKKALLARFTDLLSENEFEEVYTPNGYAYFEKTSRKNFYTFDGKIDTVFTFDSIPTLIKLLKEWVEICGLTHRWLLQAPKKNDPLKKAAQESSLDLEVETIDGGSSILSLSLADALGRYWSGPTVRLEKKGASASFFGDIKRFIALVIENFEGNLPFAFAPEQVRFIPLEGADPTEVFEIFNHLNIRYLVDTSKDLLKEKLHRGLRVKVPYVMVFGKQEEKKKQMSVRTYGSNQEQKVTLEAMKTLLAERKIESQ